MYGNNNASGVWRNKLSALSNGEVITILIAFQHSGYRTLKHFYKEYVCMHMSKDFPHLVSYNRFVELQKMAALPLLMFVAANCLGIVPVSLLLIPQNWLFAKINASNNTNSLKTLDREDTHPQDGFWF